MKYKPSPNTAVIAVAIKQFRSVGGIFPISATYKLVSASPGVKVKGGDIIVSDKEPATLVFRLPDQNYVFVGATYDAPEASTDVGTSEFPRISINRTPTVNTLTMHDANDPKNRDKAYNYVLLVQSAKTGDIGLIDPAIVNEGGP